MDVCLDCSLRERFELGPIPFFDQRSTELEGDTPVFKFDLWCWSSRKNRETCRCMLTGWNSVFQSFLSAAEAKAAGNRRAVHGAVFLLVLAHNGAALQLMQDKASVDWVQFKFNTNKKVGAG